MISDSDIHLWFLARSTPAAIIAEYLGAPEGALSFSRNAFGKPRLEMKRGLSFNLSHAGKRHLLALSSAADGNRIGVDLLDTAALDAFKSPSCRELLMDHFPAFYSSDFSDAACTLAFSRLWTQCEAVLKAQGIGLNKDGLPLHCCALNQPMGQWRAVDCDGGPLHLVDMELMPGFHAAVAVPLGYKTRDIYLFEKPELFFIERPLKARQDIS